MKKKEESDYIGKTKGVLTIVGIEKQSTNKKYTEVRCVCSRCGKVSIVRADRIVSNYKYATYYCTHCRNEYYIEEARKKYLGKTCGVLTCTEIKVNDSISHDIHKRIMLICVCSSCGAITEVRPDRFSNKKYQPVSCSNCYSTYVGKKVHERYVKLSKAVNEEQYKEQKKDKSRLLSYKNGALARNLNWNLTDEEAIKLFHSPCSYCGESHPYGIDRIDSTKGYYKENVVPCCSACNIMKNKFSRNLFMSQISKIYNHLFCLEGSTTISEESTL